MKVSGDCSVKDCDSNTIIKSKINNLLKPSLIALAVAQSLSMTSAVDAATIYVGGPNGAGCGLANAILSANNDVAPSWSSCEDGSGDDVIELNWNVTLRSAWRDNASSEETAFGLPLITSNITINGNGHSIARDPNASGFGIISTRGAEELILNDLTLSNGVAINYRSGSAIDSDNLDLTLNNVSVINNTGAPAILKNGSINSGENGFVSINNSNLSNNEYSALKAYQPGTLTVADSSISNNSGFGISLQLANGLNITDSQIDNNAMGIVVSRNDLGVDQAGPVSIKNSSINRNADGGITLVIDSSVEIINSEISNNGLTGGISRVGGIRLFSWGENNPVNTFIIDDTTISNNYSNSYMGGGGIRLSSVNHSNGVDTSYFRTTISNSTLTGNSASANGGAISSAGASTNTTDPSINREVPHTISNSTISGNSAGGSGGAIYLQGDNYINTITIDGARELTLVNSTVIDNSASQGGAIATGDVGRIFFNFSNSIIAGNSASVSGSEINNLSALSYPNEDFVDSNNNVLGSSLESNFQAFNGFVPSDTDITATINGNSPAMLDVIVSPLQDNGGSTQTHALPVSSPAIDAGDLDTCLNDPVNGLDQRGEARGDLGLCDIGSYELAVTGALPSISVESAKPAVYEGNIGDSRVIAYTFKLSSPQTEKVSFDYQTIDETAVGSVDYEIRSGRVTFTPGQVSQVRAIKLIGDANVEADETFKVVLSNPSGNAELDLNQSEALGTILNDEFGGSVPSISIESSKPSVYEGDAGDNRVIVFTFILSSALTEEASFDYQTQDVDALGGVDYQMRSGIVTFAPGQVNQVRGIQLIGDSEVEANETFKVVLSNASGNATLDLNKSEALGTILNNDW